MSPSYSSILFHTDVLDGFYQNIKAMWQVVFQVKILADNPGPGYFLVAVLG